MVVTSGTPAASHASSCSDDSVGRGERGGLGRRGRVQQEAVGAVDVEDGAVRTFLATVDNGLDLGRGGDVDGCESVGGVRLLHQRRERVGVEPGERRDDQRPLVAGGPELGGSGNRCRTHLVGLTGSGRDGPRQLVPQVAGDRLFRFPLPAEQAAGLDVDGRRSAERVGRSRRRHTGRVVEHHPGGLPVAACDGLIEHRCAQDPPVGQRPGASHEARARAARRGRRSATAAPSSRLSARPRNRPGSDVVLATSAV